MISQWRGLALASGLLGLSGVVLAALGSHAVPGMGEPETWRSWHLANFLQLLHAPALLALAFMVRRQRSLTFFFAGLLLTAGVLLFSVPIYVSTITGAGHTWGLPPIGGFMLMGGWLMVIVAAMLD